MILTDRWLPTSTDAIKVTQFAVPPNVIIILHTFHVCEAVACQSPFFTSPPDQLRTLLIFSFLINIGEIKVLGSLKMPPSNPQSVSRLFENKTRNSRMFTASLLEFVALREGKKIFPMNKILITMSLAWEGEKNKKINVTIRSRRKMQKNWSQENINSYSLDEELRFFCFDCEFYVYARLLCCSET